MERLFSRTLATLEQRGAAVELRVGGPEQFGATQLVVADNWGGLFDGDGNSTATSTDAPVVADNWGGHFDEIPAFFHEPASALDAISTDSVAPAPTPSSAPASTLPPPTSSRVILGSILRVAQIEGVDMSLALAASPRVSRLALFPRYFTLDATTGSALRLLDPEPIQHQVLVGVLTFPGCATFAAALRARNVRTGLWPAQGDYPILDVASTPVVTTVRPAPVMLTKLPPTKCSMYCHSGFTSMVQKRVYRVVSRLQPVLADCSVMQAAQAMVSTYRTQVAEM